MEGEGRIEFYSVDEERWNIISHGLGVLLSCIALVLLMEKAVEYNNTRVTVSFSIFAAGLILLYLASTCYHSAQDPALRHRLKIFDHVAIFILIAATYTPFALITLRGTIGWAIFGVAWGVSLVGTILKIFFTGKFKMLSTILYVGMGWMIIAAIKPLIENLATGGLWWLFSGGIFYTLGAFLYSFNRIKYNHAFFHLFVLFGSFSHFMSVYFFVTPIKC